MKETAPPTPRDRPRFTAITATLFVALLASVAGFVVFPTLSSSSPSGLWYAICVAAGVTTGSPATPVVAAGPLTSTAILDADALAHPQADSIGRGATLAHKCSICHAAQETRAADTPDLSGQPALAIEKELQDFRSGARMSAVMTPQMADLTRRDIRDLASYYGSLPSPSASCPAPTPAIVAVGAPMRGVAPCAACHASTAGKPGAPMLFGQSERYLSSQLASFASGARHNDINRQMRNVARGMSSTEIASAANYYACGSAQDDAPVVRREPGFSDHE